MHVGQCAACSLGKNRRCVQGMRSSAAPRHGRTLTGRGRTASLQARACTPSFSPTTGALVSSSTTSCSKCAPTSTRFMWLFALYYIVHDSFRLQCFICCVLGYCVMLAPFRLTVFEVQIPNFVLAAPTLLLACAASRAYIAHCLLYTSPSPRDRTRSRMPSSA